MPERKLSTYTAQQIAAGICRRLEAVCDKYDFYDERNEEGYDVLMRKVGATIHDWHSERQLQTEADAREAGL